MKLDTFEAIYPTKHARELADEAMVKLPGTLSYDEHERVWLATYEANGGIVKRPK